MPGRSGSLAIFGRAILTVTCASVAQLVMEVPWGVTSPVRISGARNLPLRQARYLSGSFYTATIEVLIRLCRVEEVKSLPSC